MQLYAEVAAQDLLNKETNIDAQGGGGAAGSILQLTLYI